MKKYILAKMIELIMQNIRIHLFGKSAMLLHDSFLQALFHTKTVVAKGHHSHSSRQSPQFTFHIFSSLDTSTNIAWAHSQHFQRTIIVQRETKPTHSNKPFISPHDGSVSFFIETIKIPQHYLIQVEQSVRRNLWIWRIYILFDGGCVRLQIQSYLLITNMIEIK